jgi:hypothetical protein
MRKCPACDEQTDDGESICAFCGYADPGWQQNLHALPLWLNMIGRPSRFEYVIPISSFVDSNELAYELQLFERGWQSHDAAIKQQSSAGQRVHSGHPLLQFNFQRMAYDWDSSIITDEFTGDLLPASVGIAGLIDARRAMEVAGDRWQNQVHIEALLPPSNHPVTDLLTAANLIPAGVRVRQSLSSRQPIQVGKFGALETIVPVYRVTAQTKGQLPDNLYERLDELARVGQIDQQFYKPLRNALQELADNGCRYGNQECTVAVFLRNEAIAGQRSAVRLPLTDTTVKQVHLFMFCYTTGPTFAGVRGVKSEREAVASTLAHQPATGMGSGLGLGLGGTLSRVRDRAEGTILISSGGYTRIDMPTGIVREWTVESGIALPGVLTCLLIPLANVAAVATPATIAASATIAAPAS